MMSTKSPPEFLNILNQGQRLTAEATQNAPNINEAYLVVHAAMARAFAGALLMRRVSDDAFMAASLAEAWRQPLDEGLIGHCVAP